MNNKEKQCYLTDLLLYDSQLTPFDTQLIASFLRRVPATLYKYRRFDKFSFDMIENGYVYLTPVKSLDDPFDCLNDPDLNGFYDERTKMITSKAIRFIVKQVYPHGTKEFSEKELEKLAIRCVRDNGIDFKEAPKIIKTYGTDVCENLDPLFCAMTYFNDNLRSLLKDHETRRFTEKALSPQNTVGLCSLSEERDNEVMWSLYGGGYSGYCVEFEIPKIKEVISDLCPVIYTKSRDNQFIKKTIEYLLAASLWAATNGRIKGNIGAIMESFCTKDIRWSYQSEWRIIGSAKERFRFLKVKSVYLGFKIKPSNENRMKKSASRFGFKLYKMSVPSGKKISYKEVL